MAARGGDAVVLIDTLERRARRRRPPRAGRGPQPRDGGSLTVIATAPAPLGGETTVVALDGAAGAAALPGARPRSPAGTVRPELLVGDAGAEAIARARIEAVDQVAAREMVD